MKLFTQLETRSAEMLGNIARRRLGPRLWCETTGVKLTRGKIRGESRNLMFPGFVLEDTVKALDKNCYEVVYQCRTTDYSFTVSLSEEQVKLGLERSKYYITKYGCIWHLFHRFGIMLSTLREYNDIYDIGSSIEVYPQEYIMAENKVGVIINGPR